MKCPYCKIHYMDDERRCPMCDHVNPNFYRVTSKKTRTTRQGQEKYTPIRKNSTVRPASEPQTQNKKKNTLAGIVGIVIALLGVVAPVLENVASDVVSQVQLWMEPEPEGDVVDVSVETPPLQEDIPESAYEVLDGEWCSYDTADTYLYFNLTYQEYVYTQDAQTASETGVITVYENSMLEQEDGSPLYLYNVTFYPTSADGYTLCIGGTPDENTLFSMPYDADGYPDTNQITLWERTNPREAA